jgi:dihydroneopterin aldolase
VDVVVKVGGGMLAAPGAAALAGAASERRIVIVPGGGPFADAVREADAKFTLPDATAHWMAVLAMDQTAHLLASRAPGCTMVRTPGEIDDALSAGRLPVLAPAEWLWATDPLPHAWQVTSDSIAAWIAGRLGARRLVLVKPPGVRAGDDAVDRHLAQAMPPDVALLVLGADEEDALASAIAWPPASAHDGDPRGG